MELENKAFQIETFNNHSFFTRTRNRVGSVFYQPEERNETVGGHEGYRNPGKEGIKKINRDTEVRYL